MTIQENGLISIIMPCFNAEQYVCEAVESVLSQSYPHVEVIVVNDGSTDQSRAILDTFGQRITVIDQECQGPYPARNRGIQVSRGEFIAFLDADDYWHPECLEKLHGALIDSDAALAYCGWQNVGKPRQGGEPYVPMDYENEDKLESFLRGAALWPIHAALVRRKSLVEIGGFDTHWPTCMDYDLWLRLSTVHPIALVPEVLAFYRHHDQGQITSKQWRQAKNSWLVKKKFIRDHPELVGKLSRTRLRELVDGGLLRRGYDNYWRRDLVSARKIFHLALLSGYWKVKDLRYLLPALLPERLYLSLIDSADRKVDKREQSL